MLQPHQRASRLRVVTLASTVALVAAVPLAAAVAGQDARLAAKAFEAAQPRHGTAGEPEREGERLTVGESEDERRKAGERERGAAGERGNDEREAARRGAAAPGRPSSSCGPEIASPEGVEARACVVTEGEETWARAYYRNTTPGTLPALLTLRGPEGRTTQVRCTMAAAAAPGVCETPRGDGEEHGKARAHEAYSAVAEVVSADGRRRLLRAASGS
ncbi:hypothetical protein MMF93_16065 [Streptomyces tubbatahanensis]|uniref:Uncharacterized protein n=1 Tax=Streptomyces tubbatahanensis TaxID=2923272 RepID=A0ABY3XTJ5_9ACTN|nr:hypothetical protein [Streptomyces tubbatahanensis]UNS97814.1 hypothetical protein MMF93_16065 [Streptomyces tubbatahanensis]